MRHLNQKPIRIKGSYNPAYLDPLYCQHGIWRRACSECRVMETGKWMHSKIAQNNSSRRTNKIIS